MSSVIISGDTSGAITVSAPAVAGTNTITAPAVTGTMVVLPTTPSVVRLNTANGYGSTNTVIRRFTNVVTNQGSDITYADSATLGATFTINADGIYAMSYGDQFNTNGWSGFSLNSTQLTTGIQSITISTALFITISAGANLSVTAQSTLYLASGSVIRAHTSGAPSGSNTAACSFTITRVA